MPLTVACSFILRQPHLPCRDRISPSIACSFRSNGDARLGQGVELLGASSLSLIVVLTALPRITPAGARRRHQPSYRAVGDVTSLPLQLPPYLSHPVDLDVLVVDALDLRQQGGGLGIVACPSLLIDDGQGRTRR